LLYFLFLNFPQRWMIKGGMTINRTIPIVTNKTAI
jgi:hypothetical protein